MRHHILLQTLYMGTTDKAVCKFSGSVSSNSCRDSTFFSHIINSQANAIRTFALSFNRITLHYPSDDRDMELSSDTHHVIQFLGSLRELEQIVVVVMNRGIWGHITMDEQNSALLQAVKKAFERTIRGPEGKVEILMRRMGCVGWVSATHNTTGTSPRQGLQ
jgi:hypothetical protein